MPKSARYFLALVYFLLSFISANQVFSADTPLVRAGQTLDIQVEGEKDLTGLFVISPEGEIQYPFLGTVYVDGLHEGEIQNFIYELLSKDYLVNPKVRVKIALGAVKSDSSSNMDPKIKKKDTLEISVENEKELSKKYQVDKDGAITLPLIGALKVEGLTAFELESLLVENFGKDYLVNPKITVKLTPAIKPAPAKKDAPEKKAGKSQASAAATELQNADRELDFKFNLIRAGDKLKIDIYQDKEMSGVYTVSSNGKIDLPILGEIYVEGLLMDELESFLKEALKDYLIDPKIDISFAESLTKSVSILGPVGRPGNYNLRPDMTLIRLISEVGGFSIDPNSVSMRLTRTTRDGKDKLMQIDFQAIMSGKQKDILLEPNDVIYVSEARAAQSAISILGQVMKPGNYPYSADVSLIRLVSQTGGFTPVAAASRVRIVRMSKTGQRETLTVNANAVLDGRAEDFKLEAGDIIVVPESFF